MLVVMPSMLLPSAKYSYVTHINSRIVDYCAMRNIAGFLAIGVAVMSTGCCNILSLNPYFLRLPAVE
jgi:hypothetical protein